MIFTITDDTNMSIAIDGIIWKHWQIMKDPVVMIRQNGKKKPTYGTVY